MKATIDIPTDLYRLVKAKSALEGRRIRDVTIELYRQWLDTDSPIPAETREDWPTNWFRLADEVLAKATKEPTTGQILERDRGRLDRR